MSNNSSNTAKQIIASTTELLDSEVQQVAAIIFSVQQRYQRRSNTAANLEAMRDEVLTRLAEVGILANVDPTPALYGEPPVCDIVGKVSDPGFVKPHDHEKHAFEVKKAITRNEEHLGQKERVDARKPHK